MNMLPKFVIIYLCAHSVITRFVTEQLKDGKRLSKMLTFMWKHSLTNDRNISSLIGCELIST